MAMTSIGLRPAIDRRTRATYSLRSAPPALSGSIRSSSVPATARHILSDLDSILPLFGVGDDGIPKTVTTPAGSVLPTASIRTAARSLSPAKIGTRLKGVERRFLARAAHDDDVANRQRARQADHVVEQTGISTEKIRGNSPLRITLRAPPTTPTATIQQRAQEDLKVRRSADVQGGIDISDDSLGECQGEQSPSPRASRSNTGNKMKDMGCCRERSNNKAPSSGLGMPGKLMELVEDRDRAVQLCLQYRSKMKDSEKGLRESERRVCGLKRQLQAASIAGENTRKLVEEAAEKATAAEEHKHRLEARARQGDRATVSGAEDARKTRLQLARARKDLRELWLERDELAKLAGTAMQDETRCRKRIKTLEFVVAGLREKLEDMALAEKKAAGTVERAEARATSAEGSERDLRASVEAIKVDFEALVEDLRQRDKKIQHLETEREALAVQCAIFMSTASATVATKTGPTAVDSVGGSQERPDLSQEQRETGTPAGEKNMTETRELSDTPSPVGLPHESNSEVRGSGVEWSTNAEEKHPVKGFEAGKRRASHGDGVKVHPDRGRRRSMDNKRGARTIKFSQKSDTAAETQHRDRGTDPRSASTALPAGDGSRLQRKQLAPPTTVGLRRVSTMSYPHHGGRVTLTSASETSGLKDKITGGKAEKAPASTESGSAKRVPDEPSKAEDAEVSVPRTAKIPCPAPPMPRRPSSGSVTGRTATPTPAPTPTPPLPCHPRAEASLSAEDPRESVVHLSSSGERTESSDGRVALKSLTPTEPAADIYEEKGEEVCETDPQEGLAGPLATRSSLDIIVGNEEPRQVRGDVVLSTPTPTRLNDGDASGVVPTRLVDGVRVVKHSGRGKPRPKVLWVTPDLSEIFYTSVGRTNNAKQTSRMPLAELRIARGRGDCPELLRAHSDRCFALSRSDRGARSGSSIDDGSGADAIMSSTAPAATTSRGRKRWGFGGTPSPSEGHGIFWRGRTVSGVGGLRFFSGLGATTVRSGSGGGGGSGAGGGGGRERMGLETDSVEERDALVSEINELVRLASLRASLGDCSYRGRDLFDEWCRSSPLTGGA